MQVGLVIPAFVPGRVGNQQPAVSPETAGQLDRFLDAFVGDDASGLQQQDKIIYAKLGELPMGTIFAFRASIVNGDFFKTISAFCRDRPQRRTARVCIG